MQNSEFEKLVNGLCLETIDMNGGHTFLHRHISDEELMKRVKNSNILAATVFDIEDNDVLEYAKKALLEFEPDLIDWLNDDKDEEDYVAYFNAGVPIGPGYYKAKWHEWKNGPVECDTIAVVCRKRDRKYDSTFKVVSLFPMNEIN